MATQQGLDPVAAVKWVCEIYRVTSGPEFVERGKSGRKVIEAWECGTHLHADGDDWQAAADDFLRAVFEAQYAKALEASKW